MSIAFFTSPSTDEQDEVPTEEDGNEYTTKRIEQAKKAGRSLTGQDAEVFSEQADIQALQLQVEYGFLEPDNPEEFQDNLQKEYDNLEEERNSLQNTIDRVQAIKEKPVPSQPGPAERLRISDVSNADQSYGYGVTRARLHKLQRVIADAAEHNHRDVLHNVRFKNKPGTPDMDPEKAAYSIGEQLDDKALALSGQPDYTDGEAARIIKTTHQATDYELLDVAARNKGIRIEDRDLPGFVNHLSNLLHDTETRPPQDVLTGSTTIGEKIRRAEQTEGNGFAADEDTAKTRKQYFKEALLTEEESITYENHGEWLPSQGITSTDSNELKQRFEHYQDNHIPSSYLTEATVTMDNALNEAARDAFKEHYRKGNA